MNLFYQPSIVSGANFLDAEESKHCVKVLRKRPGDKIWITDGLGSIYEVLLTKTSVQQCEFKVESITKTEAKNFHIHIAIAPTKNADRIEWFVEKAVEVGVDEITFIQCSHSERSTLKTDRVKKLAINAMKQSQRTILPKINTLLPFQSVVQQANTASRFIAYVDQTNPHHLLHQAKPNGNYIVIIGPEGDFSNDELAEALKHGFEKVSLGSNRLRTETAGLVACHILNLINT